MTSAPQRSKILIVEDDAVVAADLRASLDGLGYRVVGVTDTGAGALAEVERSSPDVVLMDIGLTGAMDGITAARAIRTKSSVPVVFVTASTDESTLVRASEAGPYGFVLKPFRTKELNATILVALQQHRLAREVFSEQTWLRTMLQSLNDGVVATDAEGRIRYINPTGADLVGFSPDAVLGELIEQVYTMTTISNEPVAMCQLRRAVADGAPVEKARFLLHRRDGRAIPVEDSASPILSAAQVIGAVGVFVDISERLRREREIELERERLEEQVQLTTEALGATRSELRALSDHLMRAQEEERRRVARELHDDLSQHAALADFELARVSKLLPTDGDPTRQLVESARQRMSHLSAALRDVSHRLHPSVVEHLGLRAALGTLVDEYSHNGGEVTFSAATSDPPELPAGVATAMYRIAQEALRNASKHAPGAPVRVTLDKLGNELQLKVEDAGPGFDLKHARAAGGLGLLSMQERARLAGGSLVLRSTPGDGTLVLVRVPIDAQPQGDDV